MPGKSGTELLPEIRTSFPETAVIMASAVTEARIIIQCIKEGAQDYIRKPFSLGDVLLSVDRSLEKSRLEAQIWQYQQHAEKKVREELAEIRKFFLHAIETLVYTLEANDRYMAGHSQGVTEITLAIGRQLGLSSDPLEDLHWAALLHDVGKIAVDPHILNKPDKLTPDEYGHIMSHAVVGPKIVQPLVNGRVVDVILHHHDHYDGSGLDQLSFGDDIPLGARIVAVADAFDAMTSERPYRPVISGEQALAEIERCAGTQFDPTVVNAFLKMAGPQGLRES
jgi:response regulator RpfG family c-di-GMP phosphodiesterase